MSAIMWTQSVEMYFKISMSKVKLFILTMQNKINNSNLGKTCITSLQYAFINYKLVKHQNE